MYYVRPATEAQQTRARVQGWPVIKSHYFERRDEPNYPHAYLVEQDGGSRVRTHFHCVDQWQIFVAGDGVLGRTRVSPVTVQYAGAYTGYGPIEAGDGGLAYLTLRPEYDPGASFLPETKKLLSESRQQPRRLVEHVDISDIPKDEWVSTFPPAEGVGGALFTKVRAEEKVGIPDHVTAPRFLVLLEGSASVGGRELTPLSCLFAGRDDTLPEVISTADSTAMLLCTFP